jgi:hypothetical protein
MGLLKSLQIGEESAGRPFESEQLGGTRWLSCSRARLVFSALS